MINCKIRVSFAPGVASVHLTKPFESTCDAVIAALELYPDARRISVIAQRSPA